MNVNLNLISLCAFNAQTGSVFLLLYWQQQKSLHSSQAQTFSSSAHETAKLRVKARCTDKSETVIWTLYFLYGSLSPFLTALPLTLTYTFGTLLYLAGRKEESWVSWIEKHVVVIISLIQSREKTRQLLCKTLSAGWCVSVQHSQELVLLHLPLSHPGTWPVLTVRKRCHSLPCPQKQSACLNTVLLGHPLQCLSARKTQQTSKPPSLSGRLSAEVQSWGARNMCIFTWKCRSMPHTECLNVGVRGSTVFWQCRVIAKLPCSQTHTQQLCPPQIEQKMLRKGVRDCWVDRNWAALIQPLFHMPHPPPLPLPKVRGTT